MYEIISIIESEKQSNIRMAKRHKNKKIIRFKDLEGWTSIKAHSQINKIYNDKGAYVGFYSEYYKCVFLLDCEVPKPIDCKNLHAAMRYIYLKTKRPNIRPNIRHNNKTIKHPSDGNNKI